ncbi:MAG TPA: chorismate-binding protein [Actinocrinis sp.]|uniref:chorismate-binding protein n=1 Tax=Actinocrinis sp. TaxID=1920516 RepID=UPI002DDD82BB|nr:chorismate-binding protein [Actinocrinis sp.]HEV2346918.1 chorismate-binding protein [Actinocrinis sp.]
MPQPPDAYAFFSGLLATDLREVARDPAALERPGWWAVVGTFEGAWTLARFADVRPARPPRGGWSGPAPGAWRSSLDRPAYESGVRAIRDHIAAGDVYQANLCRVLSAPIAPTDQPSGLSERLVLGNPAPYAGVVDLPEHGVRVVSASPELYLSRDGDLVISSPIKGTGRTEQDLLPKDTAENVMIVDLVRNDLSRVATPGSVSVPELCVVEKHPGLVHLVSSVHARLRRGVTWRDLLDATFPPGSVTGAPKHSALGIINRLEPVPRGPYCGAVGWIDSSRGTARLAVGIRTFWFEGGELRFGTGAGITWGSDPAGEWCETQLKASRLVALASRT